ncbi:uncharacterized protein ACJ7VT_021004 isoform 2-T2 [Polymixia lowei]
MAVYVKHILLSILIQGYMLCGSRAWHVKMPSNIKGLKGSCLVIPCSYDYYQYPPKRPNRVVWYQHVSRGYPLVYDSWNPNSVTEKFRGKTSRVGIRNNICNLQINPVGWEHHREKIYPWVDPENVGRNTYAFYDKSVTIEVLGRAESPIIQIIGSQKVGEEVTVQCVVFHTCPSYPPTLSLDIPLKGHKLTHGLLSDGQSTTTLTTTLVIEERKQTVKCSVQHHGGLTASAYETLNARCSIWLPSISHKSQEFLEGKASKVTCYVYYSCPEHVPTLTWNYGSMPASTKVTKTGNTPWKSVSTLTFTASAKDQGRSLTCYAHFSGASRHEESITLQVKRAILSRDWSFTTPGSITSMRGSCVVIPCSFTYISSQPAGLSVIWYLYQSHGHPVVFDQTQSIIDVRFRGRTRLIGSVEQGNCSLQIERLEMSHNQARLYPWIDKNPITSYHTVDQNFYDKTSQLVVSDQAQQPQVSIIGIPRVGEQSSVSCRAHHTCPSAPPSLTLSHASGADHITHAAVSDGIWDTIVERTWNVTEEDQSVTCTVRHTGGQTATTEVKLNVECPSEDIGMDEETGEFTEGLAKYVICSVSHKCKKDKPAITWNYKDMQSSVHTEVSKDAYRTMSNLTFIATLDDNGKRLKCTAQFTHRQTSASTLLLIKKYEKPIEEIPLHDTDASHVLAADVLPKVSALTRSCVVVPCSFQVDGEPITNLRGIWYNRAGGFVYHNGLSQVLDHFKGRTKILGNLDQQNCTLEIDDIKSFDNGPFCFRAESGKDKYRFNNSCVFIVMRASPEKPVMSPVPAEVDAGSTVSVTCSVRHTCPSRPPVFSWSVHALTTETNYTWIGQGIWESSSTITFMSTGGDGVKNLTCTALFWRGKQQATTASLNVKGSLRFQMRGTLPVVLPASAVVLIIIILAAVFGVIIWRKRGHSDSPLRPPLPEKRRSLWDRLSRRYPEDRQRPPRPDKRRSIWNRFSRVVEGRAGWLSGRGQRRPKGNTANLDVCYMSNTQTVKCHNQTAKPCFPSPNYYQRSSTSAIQKVDSLEDCDYENF